MQFSLTFCTLFSMLSKHLEFLSFQTAHQIAPGIILHLPLSLACTPSFPQLIKASATFLGMVQEMPLRLRNILHKCWVYLQCKNRWLTVSDVSPHRKHLEHKVIPLFITLSYVRAASLAINLTKQETL